MGRAVNVVMGMNKIFLGLERYNISADKLKAFAVANKLVMQQSREPILSQVRAHIPAYLYVSKLLRCHLCI